MTRHTRGIPPEHLPAPQTAGKSAGRRSLSKARRTTAWICSAMAQLSHRGTRMAQVRKRAEVGVRYVPISRVGEAVSVRVNRFVIGLVDGSDGQLVDVRVDGDPLI